MQMCWVCTLDCVFECVHTTVADFSCSGNKCVFAQLRSIINLLSILECVHSHLLWQAAVWIYSKCQPVQPAISIINLYSKIVPGCDAPLAVCVSLVTTCMFVPPPPLITVTVLQHLLYLASLTPAWNPATLLALFAPSSSSSRHCGTHAGSDPRSGASIPSSSPPWHRIDTGHWRRPSAVATCEGMT